MSLSVEFLVLPDWRQAASRPVYQWAHLRCPTDPWSEFRMRCLSVYVLRASVYVGGPACSPVHLPACLAHSP